MVYIVINHAINLIQLMHIYFIKIRICTIPYNAQKSNPSKIQA